MSTEILVDDADPSIQYSPGWVSQPSSLDFTDPDYPMYGTLHETVTQSEWSFSFTGSASITACGHYKGNSSQVFSDPSSWNCLLDGVQVRIRYGQTATQICCRYIVGTGPEGNHEIQVSANGSPDRPISFDYLVYITSSAVPSADLILIPNDPQFKYTDGWKMEGGTTVAYSTGANFTFEFYGAQILWFGTYNTTWAGPEYNETIFSYAVDGIPNGNGFVLTPEVAQKSGTYLTLFFQTFAFTRGKHKLEVFYEMAANPQLNLLGGQPIPLSLSNLVVRNSTTSANISIIPSATLSPSSGTLSTSLETATESSVKKGVPKGHLTIILGSSCGVAILVLLILGIFCVRCRMKRRRNPSHESGPSGLVVPFSHDPAAALVGIRQKARSPVLVQDQPAVETVEVDIPPSYITELYNP
ncbi:hypothetical protein GALMADRAFT_147430 [Galerina marginata CBS 339.88]|uniref:Uncharacterized protein n=1 Tax=Galerina marginata (strain CBS 339.88) TaxID=685588 RepID=A0A067SH05_GALM3|nr:hypothetical protein GALMADRAFT_147430 [Galerina marginata CBS 339.88]